MDYKLSLNLLGKYLVCLLMCFFTFSSFTIIFSLTNPPDVIGQYVAVFETEESTTPIEEYTHYFENGEDVKKAEYEKKGYNVVAHDITDALRGTPAIVSNTISQIISLVFFVIIVPYVLYKEGIADINRVSCGRVKEDKLKGFKAGIPLAAIQFVSWILLILAKVGILQTGHIFYKFINYHIYGIQQLILLNTNDPTKIPVWSLCVALLPVIITLFVCWLTYLLGYKDINIYDKLVYKKK